MDLTTFSVVIPTYRRPDVLAMTLRSLEGLETPPERWECIVVDDGSGDETEEVVRAFPFTSYILQANQGAAAARNAGARAAANEVLVFLDDDMLVRGDHLRGHEEARQRFGNCLVNGHWEFPEEMLAQMQDTPFGRFRIAVEAWVKEGTAKRDLGDGYFEPSTLTACNLGVDKQTFFDLGAFDESFLAAGAEDQDFSVRAEVAGHRFLYSTRIVLRHNDGRLTFRQFCRRQQQGARSARHLARKYPDRFGDRPLIAENVSIRRTDRPVITLKKGVKAVLSRPPALAGLHVLIDAGERVAPRSRVLQRAYWFVTGLYIFRGIRDR